MWERRCSGLALRQYLQPVIITINIFLMLLYIIYYHYIDKLLL